MSTVNHRRLYRESLARCRRWRGFVPTFYDRFTGSSEEVARKFRSTDFDAQNDMLIRSLELVADATDGLPEGLHELAERARTHDRRHLDIRSELYDLWLESILSTAADFDTEWNDEVAESWRAILDHAIHFMIRRY